MAETVTAPIAPELARKRDRLLVIFGLLRLAYETFYRNRDIPYERPDTLRFLTSLPKLRY